MEPSLLPFVLAGMTAIAPGRDHAALGAVIAKVIESEPPMYADDEGRRRTASMIIAIGFREGSLRLRISGDHGCLKKNDAGVCIVKGKVPHSFCTMQIHDSSGGSEALNDDPEACIRKGLGIARKSMSVCPSAPIAWYAVGGPPERACTSPYGMQISRDRVATAGWIFRAASKEIEAFFAPEGAALRCATPRPRRAGDVHTFSICLAA